MEDGGKRKIQINNCLGKCNVWRLHRHHNRGLVLFSSDWCLSCVLPWLCLFMLMTLMTCWSFILQRNGCQCCGEGSIDLSSMHLSHRDYSWINRARQMEMKKWEKTGHKDKAGSHRPYLWCIMFLRIVFWESHLVLTALPIWEAHFMSCSSLASLSRVSSGFEIWPSGKIVMEGSPPASCVCHLPSVGVYYWVVSAQFFSF